MIIQFLLQAIATLLSLVSTVLGIVAMLQVYEVTRMVAVFLIPIDPKNTIAHGPQVIFVARVVLIILAISLLSVSIPLFEKNQDSISELRRLIKMFSLIGIIELAVIGLAVAIIYVPPGLVLDVTP